MFPFKGLRSSCILIAGASQATPVKRHPPSALPGLALPPFSEDSAILGVGVVAVCPLSLVGGCVPAAVSSAWSQHQDATRMGEWLRPTVGPTESLPAVLSVQALSSAPGADARQPAGSLGAGRRGSERPSQRWWEPGASDVAKG